jgi:hypothetical protein
MRAVILAPLLAVGLVGFVFVRWHSGDSGSFPERQRQAQTLTPAAVAAVVRAAPDPNAGPLRGAGIDATCASLGSGLLGNPWRCSIRYPSGRVVRYRVTIGRNGSWVGDHELVLSAPHPFHDVAVVKGCCVAVP